MMVVRRTIREWAPAAIIAATVVALVVLSFAVGNVVSDQRELAERVEGRSEVRAYELCQAHNDTRQVLGTVLDVLAAPRDDDEPGEYERRLELREDLDPLVEPVECPPDPRGGS